MGFPVGYTEHLLPRIFLCILSLLGLLRQLIYTIFWLMGQTDFLESDPTSSSSWPEPASVSTAAHHQESRFFYPVAARLAGEIIPVVRFSENQPGLSEFDSCAVCLDDFEDEEEIRRLMNCQHIFHRSCLDRWMMSYSQMTCPLCRTLFIPHDDDLQVDFNQRA
ncbi:putative RING zinc finger protein [Hirschfeldia incana]|nr:putative RING zinc finger protein [Hirschfeldia incana]